MIRNNKVHRNPVFLETLVATVPLPVFYKDDNGVFLGCNKAFENLIGKSKDQIIGNTVYDIISQETADKYANMDRELLDNSGKHTYEWKLESPEGYEKDLLFYSSTFSDSGGNVAGIIGVIKDVTERNHLVRKLKSNEKNMNALLNACTESIFIIDVHGKIIEANEALANRFGTSVRDLKGRNIYNFLPEDVAYQRRKAGNEVIKSRKPIHLEDKRQGHTILSSIYPVIDENSNVEKLAIFGMDITPVKEAENSVQRQTQIYKTIIEGAIDGFWHVDMEGRIVEVNDAYCRMSGYSREEILEMDISDIEANETPEQIAAHLRKVIENGADRFETKHRTKCGKLLDIEVSSSYLKEERPGFSCFLRDVTEKKIAESEKEITVDLLSLLNTSNEKDELIPSVVDILYKWSGCEAVGIRLKEGNDYPYYHTKGFPEDSVLLVNSLCSYDVNGQLLRDDSGNPVLECMCGDVICGRFDSQSPFFTTNGSFWTNSTSEILSDASGQDGRASACDRCNGEEYESFALIPIRTQGETQGLIQFNDKRKGIFSAEKVALFERLADNIALALSQRKIQEQVKQSEERLKSIFRAAPVGIGIVNNRILTNVNPLVSEMTGYNYDELIGSHARMLYPTREDFDYVGTEKYRQIEEKGTGTVVTKWLKKDGNIIDVLLSSTPMDPSDMPKGVTFTALDITEWKRSEQALKESEEKNSLILEKAPMSVLLVRNGKYIYANPLGASNLGYENPEELIGVPVENTISHKCMNEIKNRMKNLSKGNSNTTMELEVIAKDGTIKLMESVSVPVMLSDGPANLVMGSDVTEKKKIEKKLAEESIRSRVFLEQSRDGIVVLDECGKVYDSNPQFARDLGYSSEEIKNLHVWDWDAQWTKKELLDMLIKVGTDGDRFETVHRRKNGTFFNVDISSIGCQFGDRKLIFCICRDISEKIKIQNDLKENEEILNDVQNIAGIGSFVWDLRDDSLEYSRNMLSLAGISENDFSGKMDSSIHSLVHHDDRNFVEEEIRKMILQRNTWPMEFRIIRPDGIERIWESRSRFVFDENGVPVKCIGMHQDITEQRKNDEKLKILASLMETVPASVTVHDLKGNIMYANERTYEIHGYSAGDMEDFNLQQLDHPETARKIPERMQLIMDQGFASFEVCHLKKDGTKFPLQISTKLISWKGEQAVLSVALDISELKETEKTLKESNERLALAMEASSTGLWDFDLDANQIWVSSEVYEMLGYKHEDISSDLKTFISKAHPHDRPIIMETLNSTITEVKPLHMDLRLKHSSGEWVWVSMKGKPNDIDENGSPHRLIGTQMNITPRVKAEEAIVCAKVAADEANRMKDEMFKNVSHELKTPLHIILGFSDLLLSEENEPLSDSHRPYLEHIKEGGYKLLDVVDKILEYVDMKHDNLTLNLQSFNINNVVNETVDILSLKASKKNIKIIVIN
ncbi:PAS domain S-box protein [Methanolobus bombayensis]|uniref:PAS domain S-box protein n=1 Tax=Methanolobus bombayensis TaxID=38023 RepID=UPI001AE455D4|nr:PAS domain S-box protein [Methanolobus bombayensis]MBP1910723.1 PAS domain S-box-containing protein [Methanolobus bombayensis]